MVFVPKGGSNSQSGHTLFRTLTVTISPVMNRQFILSQTVAKPWSFHFVSVLPCYISILYKSAPHLLCVCVCVRARVHACVRKHFCQHLEPLNGCGAVTAGAKRTLDSGGDWWVFGRFPCDPSASGRNKVRQVWQPASIYQSAIIGVGGQEVGGSIRIEIHTMHTNRHWSDTPQLVILAQFAG